MTRLTDVQIETFRKAGYLTGLRMVPAAEMSRLRDGVLGVLERTSPYSPRDLDRYHDHYHDRHLDSALVLDLACHPAILDAVGALLGDDVVLWRTSWFVKTSQDRTTSWHQDRQFSGPKRLPSLMSVGSSLADYDEDNLRGHVPSLPQSVSAWIAIEPAKRESGCVMVVEGSHLEGVLPVKKAPSTGAQIFGKGTVIDYEIPDERVRHLELEAGEFFVFDRLTLHASVPNTVERTRIGLSVRFTTPDTLIFPGYEHDGHGFPLANYKAILVRGHDRHGRNDRWIESLAERRAKLAPGS